MNLKLKAQYITEQQFAAAYANGAGCGNYRLRQTDLSQQQAQFLLAHLCGERLLEVGCGDGWLALQLAKQGQCVVATDLVFVSASTARSNACRAGTALEAGVANVERLPFAAKAFDTVVCCHTLEHVQHFEQAIHEIIRV